MIEKKIKNKLKSVLAGYDINKIDFEKDKKLIIEDVLNCGGDEEIKWVLRNYKKKDIISVLKNPTRGLWNRKSLNFWLTIFGVKIDKEKYEKGIRKIYINTKAY